MIGVNCLGRQGYQTNLVRAWYLGWENQGSLLTGKEMRSLNTKNFLLCPLSSPGVEERGKALTF